jgi:hypothetical protein
MFIEMQRPQNVYELPAEQIKKLNAWHEFWTNNGPFPQEADPVGGKVDCFSESAGTLVCRINPESFTDPVGFVLWVVEKNPTAFTAPGLGEEDGINRLRTLRQNGIAEISFPAEKRADGIWIDVSSLFPNTSRQPAFVSETELEKQTAQPLAEEPAVEEPMAEPTAVEPVSAAPIVPAEKTGEVGLITVAYSLLGTSVVFTVLAALRFIAATNPPEPDPIKKSASWDPDQPDDGVWRATPGDIVRGPPPSRSKSLDRTEEDKKKGFFKKEWEKRVEEKWAEEETARRQYAQKG